MEQEEFLDEYTYYDDVEYESRFHEMIKQHAEELVFTRHVLYSLLHRHLSNNLYYQYSKAKYYGLKISHTDIARLCGVSPRIGVKWFDDCEKGLPGLEALSSLSLFFGCTLRELIVCHNDSADNTGDLSKNHPYLYYMDHVSEFKAKCKENSSSLRQVLGRNLKNQYSMMRNNNEKINYS